MNLDECASAINPCGPASTGCIDTDGSYTCSCSVGYASAGSGAGGTCSDLDECALGTDDCAVDADCANTPGAFSCACRAGFVGDGHGATGCLSSDASLSALLVGGGAIAPAFAPATLAYAVALGIGVSALSVTPTVSATGRATVTVDGVGVASGTSTSTTAAIGATVSIVVTAESGATRTYTLVLAGPGAPTYVKASNSATGDTFTWSIALSADGSRLAVGATGEGSNATGIGGSQTDNSALSSGAVYVFVRTGATWVQEAYVKASNTGSGDQFGSAVSISSDGSRLVVGAARESSNATGVGGDQTNNAAAGSGAAYVFARTGSTWAQEAYVKASNSNMGDGFGSSVTMSPDGLRIAVGAPSEDSNATGVGGDQTNEAGGYSGAVYVFSRTGVAWAQEAYVKASNTGLNDSFGTWLSLSSDGSRLAVSATSEDSNATGVGGDQTNNAASSSGAVYVLVRSGTMWAHEAYVKASNSGTSDQFGYSIALSSDGTHLAVGAPGEASSATGVGGDGTNNAATYSGAAYVFARVGTTWAQEAYVKASNTNSSDLFGWSVSLSSDGSRLVVGAESESSNATGVGGDQTNNTATGSGAAYVFGRSGTTWAQEAYVKASNTDPNDGFGWAVAITGDGGTLAIGAPSEDSSATGIGGDATSNASISSGAVYVF